MGIRFRCHHCDQELHVKDFQAGKRGRCPDCHGKFRIPAQTAEFSIDIDQAGQPAAQSASVSAGLRSEKQSANPAHANPVTAGPRTSTALAEANRPGNVAPKSQAAPAPDTKSLADKAKPSRQTNVGAPVATPSGDTPPGATSPGNRAAAVELSRGSSTVASPTTFDPGADNYVSGGDLSGAAVVDSSAENPLGKAVDEDAFASAPRLPAALIAIPDSTWYVRPTAGGQYGPATNEGFTQWLIEGRVERDALVWRDDWPEWLCAAEAFADYFGPQAISPLAGSTDSLVPPPIAKSAPTKPSLHSSSASNPVLSRKRRKRARHLWILSILSVVFLCLIGVLVWVLVFSGE